MGQRPAGAVRVRPMNHRRGMRIAALKDLL